MKYRVLITLFLVISAFLIFIARQNKSNNLSIRQTTVASEHSVAPRLQTPAEIGNIRPEEEKNIVQALESFEELRDYCLTRYPHLSHLVPTQQQIENWQSSGLLKRSWLNIHLKKEDNTVIRVRRFLDDGPNGSYERLVIFEEDDTGFPEIIDIPEDHRVNPSEEVVQHYLSKGVSIFTDEGMVGDLDDKNIFLELINGQVTRVDVSSGGEFLNCQSEY